MKTIALARVGEKRARLRRNNISRPTAFLLLFLTFLALPIIFPLAQTKARVFTPQECTPPPPNMVSWWPGDGNANDIQGSNIGTLEGSFTFPSGEVAQAFGFNGSDSDVKIPAAASIDVGTGGGMTIDLWIRPSDVFLRPLVEWNSSGAIGTYFWIGGQPSSGSLDADLVDVAGNHHVISSAVGMITTSTWQHVAVTYDKSSGVATLYLNGSVVGGPTTLGSFTPQTSYDLYLGSRPPGSSRYVGQMDEVEIFNRALDITEIAAIYNAGSAGKCKPVCTPPPANMISWWPGDGHPNDIQSGNNGTLVNGATYATGEVGQAFSFDGVDDRVDIADAANLNPTTAMTMDAWINPQALPLSYNAVVAKSSDVMTQRSYGMWITNTGRVHVAPSSLANAYAETVPSVVPLNTWTHVAASITAGVGYKIYVNGVDQTLTIIGAAPTLTATTVPVMIGCSDLGGSNWRFNGLIDEVEIIGRELTLGEVQAIYNAGSAGKCKPVCTAPPANMVSWWPAEGNATDVQGAHNGILQGGATFAPGRVGRAFSFDGAETTFVEVPNTADFNPRGPFTIDGWFYLDPFAAGNIGEIATLIAKTEGSTNNGWALYFDDRAGVGSSKSLKFVLGTILELPNAIPSAAWYHIAAIFDPSTTPNARLYVNGAPAASINTTGATSNSLNVRIGAMYWTDFTTREMIV